MVCECARGDASATTNSMQKSDLRIDVLQVISGLLLAISGNKIMARCN